MTNKFNDFFANVGPRLSRKILDKLRTDEDFLAAQKTDTFPNSLFLTPVSANEIIKIISRVKTDGAPGPDNIGPKVYKKVKHCIAEPLSYLINLSFTSGNFPSHLKEAVVVPVFKGGDPTDMSNYRPISLLNTISKFYESAVKTRLESFLESQNLISPNQFGFRQGRGTDEAILKLTTTITNFVDNNKKCLAVFLDLAKAFDTVSHKILLKLLRNIGVRGLAMQWFENYFTNRVQNLKIGKVISSDSRTVVCGVPQGTVLAPLFFLIYVNSLCNLNIQGHIISFADDTAVVFAGDSWDEVFALANQEMQVVQSHLDSLLLTLNVKKTKLMTFSALNVVIPDHNSLIIHSCHGLHDCDCPPIER